MYKTEHTSKKNAVCAPASAAACQCGVLPCMLTSGRQHGDARSGARRHTHAGPCHVTPPQPTPPAERPPAQSRALETMPDLPDRDSGQPNSTCSLLMCINTPASTLEESTPANASPLHDSQQVAAPPKHEARTSTVSTIAPRPPQSLSS